MTKLLDEVKELLRYEQGDRDRAILEGLVRYGSIKNLVNKTDLKRRTVDRRLAAIRNNCERFGFQKEFPETSIVTDMPAYARSIYQKFEEPRADGVTAIWHKIKSEDVTLAHAIKSVLEGMHLPPAKPTKCKIKKTTKNLAMITLADVHLGLLAYSGETGSNWGTEDSLGLLKHAIDYLVDKMDFVDEAVLANLGDLTHTDGLIAKTPAHGNPLDVDCRYFDMCRSAGVLMRYAVAQILTKAKRVRVVSIRGNHDDQTAWHLNEKEIEHYRNEPRVIIEPNDAYTRMLTWKNNMLVFTHGDSAKNQQIYEYITTKWSVDFGNSKHVHVCKGHVHHARNEPIGNTTFETFSTLTKSDAYHEFKMYKSQRKMTLINFDPEGGEYSRFDFHPRF